jgi:hypothetical protein
MMKLPDSFTMDGRSFSIPAPLVGVNRDNRMALAHFGGQAIVWGTDVVDYTVSAGTVDLGLVRTGRCPLLAEHVWALDALLGQVLTAEVHGEFLRCLVRFARSQEADRLWAMLCDGFPLSLSAGARIKHAEKAGIGRDGSAYYKVQAWELRELSICVFGRDEAAHVRRIGEDESIESFIARMNPPDEDPTRLAARRAMRLDRWHGWALNAAPRIAVEVNAEQAAMCMALHREVADHCADLERDFAL